MATSTKNPHSSLPSSEAGIIIKLLIAFFVVGICAGASHGQYFEGILVVKGIDGKNATYQIKRDKVRLEADDQAEPYALLYRSGGGSLLMLRPREKRYAEIPAKPPMNEERELNDRAKISKTGETKKMHGYMCEKWIIGDAKNHSEVWVSDELGIDYSALMAPIIKIGGEGWQQLKGHFPMRVASVANGRSTLFFEVISVERKSLSDDLFTIPSGYEKM